MKHLKVTAAISLILLTLTACQTVPATKIVLDLKTGKLNVDSPKQFEVEDIKAEIKADGTASFSAKKLKSRNDSDVIGTVAAANAAMAGKLVEVIQSGKAGAMNSVVPVP